jgi:hypothetical protein
MCRGSGRRNVLKFDAAMQHTPNQAGQSAIVATLHQFVTKKRL